MLLLKGVGECEERIWGMRRCGDEAVLLWDLRGMDGMRDVCS